MENNTFDLLIEELHKQHQTMLQLQAANRKLQSEITALQAGQGIFIEIDGQRIALNLPTMVQTQAPTPTPPTPVAPAPNTVPDTISDAPTISMPEIPVNKTTAPETPTKQASSSFLEDAMIDEFSSAMNSSTVIQQESKLSTDEQKAVLRRQLMGSYILE